MRCIDFVKIGFFSKWVCLKIEYIPNYSHLIGITISKTIGFRGTLLSDKPKWISKNGKALSTRQISRLIALQHFCIQECEIAAIAQVFSYVFLGSKHHMYRIWATLSFNWIVWAREAQSQWQVLTSRTTSAIIRCTQSWTHLLHSR